MAATRAGAARAVATIAGNELRRTARDRVAMFFVVVLPVVIIVVIGTTFGTMEGVDVGVLDRDGTAASRGLVTALDRSDGVSVERYDSLDTLRRDIRTGSVAAGLVVPDGYGDDIDRGLDATVELIADPTTGSAAAVQATVRAAVGDAAVQIAAARVAADGDDPGRRRRGEVPVRAAAIRADHRHRGGAVRRRLGRPAGSGRARGAVRPGGDGGRAAGGRDGQ
jgi:ABC-2 type transport system permease protein